MTLRCSPLAVTVLALACWGAPRDARACECGSAGGVAGPITTPDERFAVYALSMGRAEIGSWSDTGRFRGTPSGVRAIDGTLQFAGGVRIARRLELSAMVGGGAALFESPGISLTNAGWTDLTARARFELFEEPSPCEPRFASGVWFALRAPTGTTMNGGGGTAGQIGAFGLGAFETAFGADLHRTFAERWQPYLAIEGALRVPDRSLGVTRVLGPRATARAGVTYAISDVVAVSGLFEWNWEGNVTVDGQTYPGSWQQRTSLIAALIMRLRSGLRANVAISTDLPVDWLGQNAGATFRISLGIGFASRVPEPPCPMHSHAGGET